MTIINLVQKTIIPEKTIKNEDEIHNVINSQLYELFGLTLIQKKIKFDNIEIDSLCMDINCFLCVIEFKKEKDSEQLAQILNYFDNIYNNIKKINELLNINFNKDWIQLICVAKDYDEKIINLVNKLDFDGYDVLLYKYKLYDNNLLSLEKVETDKDDYFFNEFWQSLSKEQKSIIKRFSQRFNFLKEELDVETYEDCLIYKKGNMNIVEIWKGESDEQLDILFTRKIRTMELVKKHSLKVKKEKKNWFELSISRKSINNLVALLNEMLKNAKANSK